MGNIFLTSDLHLNHDREFVYKARGFNTIEEMNEAYFANHQAIVTPDDDVYILGDLMLGKNDEDSMRILSQLNGKLHIIRGNHDTDRRIELYKTLPNLVDKNILWADVLKYKKYHIYLSHHPTLTGNLENGHLSEMLLNFYGHTHQKSRFFQDRPYMYCVNVDAHDCKPVLIDDAIEEMKAKMKECKDFL